MASGQWPAAITHAYVMKLPRNPKEGSGELQVGERVAVRSGALARSWKLCPAPHTRGLGPALSGCLSVSLCYLVGEK